MRMRSHHTLCIAALLVLTSSAIFADLKCRESPSRPVEIRGVWMDRGSIPKTEQGIRNLIWSYAKAGINVVHPEVIYYGYSAYPSSYLTQKDLWNGVDMLGILIDEAHKRGIEVHPWVWVFCTGNQTDKGGIYPQHPDWAMTDKAGSDHTEKGSYWLNPCSTAVRHLLLSAIKELVEKYAVDGIELDYIRFPSPDFGYNDDCRAKFQAEYGIDPMNIEPFTKPVLDWHLWRENLINSFVAEVSTELKKIRPELKISAAVASYPDKARLNFLQNWEYWAANRWVDFLAPMDYTSDAKDFMGRVRASSDTIANRSLLAPGIGLLTQKGSEAMLEQVGIARSEPVSGVTLFATAYLDADRLKALAEGPFAEKAQLPFRSPVEGARQLISSARDRLKNESSPEDLSEAGLELESAKNLLEYSSYRLRDIGCIAPSPPPIYIPDEVVPIPEAQIPAFSSKPVIDGKLDDAVWQSAARIALEYTGLGDEATQPTEVFVGCDAENVYIAYRCHERKMERIKANVTEHDGAVFCEDSVEFFLDIEGQSKDYYQFAMNLLGTKYDARVYDAGFNPEWQGAAAKEPDAWTAEISLPFSAFKLSSPATGRIWRGNFCRNRAVKREGAEAEKMCWSPTYGSFHTPIRFGRLAFAQEGK